VDALPISSVEPNALELKIAGCRGLLKPCPFCGSEPMLYSDENESTGIWGARVECMDFQCMGSVFANSMNREKSQ
jgi:hypothetical protein